VVGYFITAPDDGQFVVRYHDHSPPTQREFRGWLQARYLTIILDVLHHAQTKLLEIALARGSPSVFARPREHREEDGRKDRYDGYNDQQFDQGESIEPATSMRCR
jgi:hypothetical protein